MCSSRTPRSEITSYLPPKNNMISNNRWFQFWTGPLPTGSLSDRDRDHYSAQFKTPRLNCKFYKLGKGGGRQKNRRGYENSHSTLCFSWMFTKNKPYNRWKRQFPFHFLLWLMTLHTKHGLKKPKNISKQIICISKLSLVRTHKICKIIDFLLSCHYFFRSLLLNQLQT